MSVQRIASRYAKSLLDLAVDQNKLERVLEDVQSFQEVSKIRDFKLMIKSPVIHAAKKADIMTKLFGDKYDKLTMAFLHILCTKNREAYLPEIAAEYIDQYKKLKKISEVKIISANPLSDAAVKAIHDKLKSSSYTNDNVEITTEVDPDLIGGFVIQFDDKLYDASIANKLNDLRKEFDENLYISQIIAR